MASHSELADAAGFASADSIVNSGIISRRLNAGYSTVMTASSTAK
jgi:hypothetical protein